MCLICIQGAEIVLAIPLLHSYIVEGVPILLPRLVVGNETIVLIIPQMYRKLLMPYMMIRHK